LIRFIFLTSNIKKTFYSLNKKLLKAKADQKYIKLINLESLRMLSQKQCAVAGAARQEIYFV
jgi:hypothetical protein